MNILTNFSNNSWVIGIVGGIISSTLVTFVTRKILSKKEEREYLQRLETANNEILYSLRPLVIDKEVPSKAIIKSILRATAQKYEVELDDLYSVSLLSDILIKEIVNNSFLSSEQKIEFTQIINEMELNYLDNKEIDKLFNELRDSAEKLRAKETYANILSKTLGIIAALVTTITLINEDISLNKINLNNFKDSFKIIPILLSIIVIAPILTEILSKFKGSSFRNKGNKSDKQENKSDSFSEE